MSRTRNQIRRNRAKAALMTVAMIAMWAAVTVLTIRALDHPAEQPISGSEYRAKIEALERD